MSCKYHFPQSGEVTVFRLRGCLWDVLWLAMWFPLLPFLGDQNFYQQEADSCSLGRPQQTVGEEYGLIWIEQQSKIVCQKQSPQSLKETFPRNSSKSFDFKNSKDSFNYKWHHIMPIKSESIKTEVIFLIKNKNLASLEDYSSIIKSFPLPTETFRSPLGGKYFLFI